eukprot:GEZU01012464.1.p1 GENE.GEZU01012464.1~~GEZU01012464.1.p1  ORF type:complete len:498 (-),score=169.58 GEZU01012464.1:175-1611(-)
MLNDDGLGSEGFRGGPPVLSDSGIGAINSDGADDNVTKYDSVTEHKRSALKDRLKAIPKEHWKFIILSLTFNLVAPILIILMGIPWDIEYFVHLAEATGEKPALKIVIANLLYNNPWFVVFNIPAVIMGVAVPAFKYTYFFFAYRIVESLSAWNMFQLGLLTVMYQMKAIMLLAAQHQKTWGTSYIALASGVLFIFVAIGMGAIALLADRRYKLLLALSRRDDYEKTKNRDYKIHTIFMHVADAVVQVCFIVYGSMKISQYYDSVPSGEWIDFGIIISFVPFGLFALIVIVADIAGVVFFSMEWYKSSYEKRIPFVFTIANTVQAGIQLSGWAIGCVIIIIMLAVSISGKNKSPQKSLAFYDGLFAMGATAMFKTLVIYACAQVMYSNSFLRTGDSKPSAAGHEFAASVPPGGIAAGGDDDEYANPSYNEDGAANVHDDVHGVGGGGGQYNQHNFTSNFGTYNSQFAVGNIDDDEISI